VQKRHIPCKVYKNTCEPINNHSCSKLEDGQAVTKLLKFQNGHMGQVDSPLIIHAVRKIN
jgi:hypothetical protein